MTQFSKGIAARLAAPRIKIASRIEISPPIAERWGRLQAIRSLPAIVALYPDKTERKAEFPDIEDEDVRHSLKYTV